MDGNYLPFSNYEFYRDIIITEKPNNISYNIVDLINGKQTL